ncbi:MAG TPA: 2-C-methyl-D-erythritol 4-phosphate cytidylyltransferase [Desulfatiglandales bacterium]|nr:2-C-methyl-D-erythritol 4-phosphate cytidylyltransferase [Desulfatiglandales bacterium]
MTIGQNSADPPDHVIAVIPAAGSGVRMGLKKAKQFMDLCGKPLLAVTLNRFQECNLIDRIVVVVSEDQIDYCLEEIVARYELSKVFKVIAGGAKRQDSVRKGLDAIANCCEWALIHDGVRPLVTDMLITRVVKATNNSRAVITGLPVKESVKEINGQGGIFRSIDRSNLWLVQTPQIFRWEDIHQAHQDAVRYGWEEATDDAFLIEKMGIPIKMIEGEEDNIKITTPKDLEIAQFLISKKSV